MRLFLVLIFSLSILSCEKNLDPIGREIFLETSKDSYELDDSVNIYLINVSNEPVFSHGYGQISKKINNEWSEFQRTVPLMNEPTREYKDHKNLLWTLRFQDTGLYKYRMYFSWDYESRVKDDLGWLYTNTIEIKIGT
jgi:hypothetical protein